MLNVHHISTYKTLNIILHLWAEAHLWMWGRESFILGLTTVVVLTHLQNILFGRKKRKDEEHPHPRPGSKHECNEPYERSYQSRYTLFVDGRITFSVKCSITRRLYSFPQKQKMRAADFNEMELIDSMIGASQESKISDGETVFSN